MFERGAASLRPSTADNTEIAGVIMESPMNIEAPTTPSAIKASFGGRARADERHQRQRAALAVVVRAQQEQHVFCRDDDKERPQDQRQHGLAR